MSEVVVQFVTDSTAQTQELGCKLGQLLTAGSLVLLIGELGAGKTAFTQGIARGLGISPDVPITSPTYTLMNSYSGRLPLYHFDLYRLGGADELYDLGFEEYFHGSGVAVVEWPERCQDLYDVALSVTITYIDETTRSIRVGALAGCRRYAQLLDTLNDCPG